MKTNSHKPKRPAEAKTSRTAKRKGDYVQRLVRRIVRYEYSTPAISCCSSYRRKMEGRVTGFRHNPTPYFGRNTLIVVSDGERNYVSIQEITHIKDSRGRWRKHSPNAAPSHAEKDL